MSEAWRQLFWVAAAAAAAAAAAVVQPGSHSLSYRKCLLRQFAVIGAGR